MSYIRYLRDRTAWAARYAAKGPTQHDMHIPLFAKLSIYFDISQFKLQRPRVKSLKGLTNAGIVDRACPV
ncbi:hypothetical protein AYI69_g923 [Smittium culicis]|uniref:Uncharacterized protein n=1 Tax=Smittium culicis TaxID=133412 RepID=A0A1R1YRQ5_9FUNG|nr:hypothetical protein AYI69_g923 [Smittium culicis]